MNFKNILSIILLLLFTNCSNKNFSINEKNNIIQKGFTNRGFALVYDPKHYKDNTISKKMNERSLVIFQKNLKNNTQVKITNISNNKSLIARVGVNANYPLFNNSVLSKRIASEIDLDINEPYIEIKEILVNSLFIAKKAKTFEEERNVATKAPVNNISINDLNEISINKEKKPKKNFSYKIMIADFYFSDTAKMMSDRIVSETKIRNPKIIKIAKDKYRVYLGPFDNINSLQKSYNDINILNFENIQIIKND
ncbi:hypothetical protein N8Z07_01485 [Pelagibacteraceae bacterium]|nr:hypothetical protein [Pelagibacteraceae bacterium]